MSGSGRTGRIKDPAGIRDGAEVAFSRAVRMLASEHGGPAALAARIGVVKPRVSEWVRQPGRRHQMAPDTAGKLKDAAYDVGVWVGAAWHRQRISGGMARSRGARPVSGGTARVHAHPAEAARLLRAHMRIDTLLSLALIPAAAQSAMTWSYCPETAPREPDFRERCQLTRIVKDGSDSYRAVSALLAGPPARVLRLSEREAAALLTRSPRFVDCGQLGVDRLILVVG